MKFFLDTANIEQITKANDMGVICGVTTNPSLIAKEGRDFKQVVAEIASIVDGPISGVIANLYGGRIDHFQKFRICKELPEDQVLVISRGIMFRRVKTMGIFVMGTRAA